jgi:hypothetical protein
MNEETKKQTAAVPQPAPSPAPPPTNRPAQEPEKQPEPTTGRREGVVSNPDPEPRR